MAITKGALHLLHRFTRGIPSDRPPINRLVLDDIPTAALLAEACMLYPDGVYIACANLSVQKYVRMVRREPTSYRAVKSVQTRLPQSKAQLKTLVKSIIESTAPKPSARKGFLILCSITSPEHMADYVDLDAEWSEVLCTYRNAHFVGEFTDDMKIDMQNCCCFVGVAAGDMIKVNEIRTWAATRGTYIWGHNGTISIGEYTTPLRCLWWVGSGKGKKQLSKYPEMTRADSAYGLWTDEHGYKVFHPDPSIRGPSPAFPGPHNSVRVPVKQSDQKKVITITPFGSNQRHIGAGPGALLPLGSTPPPPPVATPKAKSTFKSKAAKAEAKKKADSLQNTIDIGSMVPTDI